MERAAGWTADDHLAAFAAYQTSCQALLKIRRSDERAELSGALSSVCRKAVGLQPQDTDIARGFFEQNFQPVRIGRLGEAEGLLTGYFEPIVAGSRVPTPVSCPALPPAARPRGCRLQARRAGISEQRRTHRSPQREERARAVLSTAPPSRPARSTGRSSRSAGSRARPICWRSRSKALGA